MSRGDESEGLVGGMSRRDESCDRSVWSVRHDANCITTDAWLRWLRLCLLPSPNVPPFMGRVI